MFKVDGFCKQDGWSGYSFLVDATAGNMVVSEERSSECSLSYEFIQSLIARYRPVAYIHPKVGLPCDRCALEVGKQLEEGGCITRFACNAGQILAHIC